MKNCDYLIIGAGIVGLSIARELKLRHPGAQIIVIEKEPSPGLHSSGRNSGVLHSGIYYPPESLKAKVCRQGSIEMAAYHEEHGLRLDRRGKLLVATREEDIPQLDLLAGRAAQNNVTAEKLGYDALSNLEPEVRLVGDYALWVPSAAVGSPAQVMKTIMEEIQRLGISLQCASYVSRVEVKERRAILSNNTSVSYGHVINAAGLFADKVAQLFGIGDRYTLLPFKGLYWKLDPSSGIKINHLVYPVPDLRVPFLGVHTTTTTDGITYFGPTAVPAFGRENYHGLKGVTTSEAARISYLLSKQFFYNRDGFRHLTLYEGRRYFKPWFVEAARSIIPRLRSADLVSTEKVGIRAQILDRKSGRLVTDFLVECGEHSTHILNAISPAWTSAFPFARFVCDNYCK